MEVEAIITIEKHSVECNYRRKNQTTVIKIPANVQLQEIMKQLRNSGTSENNRNKK